MLRDVGQASPHVLDVVKEKTPLVGYPEHYVQYTFLCVCESEDTRQQLGPHL